jgi:hypothetical protein
MSTPQGVTMSPNSSVPQAASFVSQVSMSDKHVIGLARYVAQTLDRATRRHPMFCNPTEPLADVP